MVMRKGMEKAVETAIDTIKANSETIKGSDDIARVGARLLRRRVRRQADRRGHG